MTREYQAFKRDRKRKQMFDSRLAKPEPLQSPPIHNPHQVNIDGIPGDTLAKVLTVAQREGLEPGVVMTMLLESAITLGVILHNLFSFAAVLHPKPAEGPAAPSDPVTPTSSDGGVSSPDEPEEAPTAEEALRALRELAALSPVPGQKP